MTARSRRMLVAALVTLLAATSGAVASTVAPAGQTDAGAVVVSAERAPTPAATATAVDENGTSIVTDGEELVLEQAMNQTIRGETTLEPGAELSLNVEGESFLMTNTVTVTDRQTFDATFDFSTVGEQDIEIRVYRNETVLAEAPGRVACENDCDSATKSNTEESTRAVDGPAVQAITEVTQNRTASIEVLFGGSETVTVSVGGPEVNYVVNGTIRDRDGDGRATVLFHTNRAGTDVPTFGVVDDGETRVVEATAETPLDSSLAPGSYDVRLYAGRNATGELEAEGRIVVFAGGTEPTDENDGSANRTETTVETDERGDVNASSADGTGDRFLGGVGMIAAGGVLAVVGIGIVLGLGRN